MAWTTASEVLAAWIGPGAPTSTALVDTWIGKAERLLRGELPDLQARVDAATEPDLLGNIKDVVTEMVQRVFRNPEGVRQRQESAGSLAGSVTYGGDNPGLLEVTGDQMRRLAAPGTAGKAYMIDMIPSTSPFSPNYVAPIETV